jgi:dTDP-4-amino-4,6-dideoxygalactose transaminase
LSERYEHEKIPFQRPSLPSAAQIGRYFDLSRAEGRFSNGGPCWRLLRERLADRVGAYCVPVASGTVGLMSAIACVLEDSSGGGSGALLPSFTFPATAQAALWSGLMPKLIDIDPRHWHIDASLLETMLHDQRGELRIVLSVSAFGTPPPSETRVRWERACHSAGLPLIIDSAAGFGAIADDGTPVGAQGDVEIVSFHATKPFAIGEGGAVFTRSRTLRDRLELAINFGLAPDRSLSLARGLNGKMSELHAATALAVLDEFDTIIAGRLQTVTHIRAQSARDVTWQEGCERSTWQFIPVALVDSGHRMSAARSHQDRIELRTYYEPLHEMAAFRHWPIADGELPRTEALHRRILCLPMANDLTDFEMAAIAAVLRSNRVDDDAVSVRPGGRDSIT